MKPKLFFLFIIYNLSFCIVASATIRYVSKTGSSTPPYTSWATASDSIQKCINICQSGDTVYVANGVYKEKVVMIPDLALIGSGMDSCIVDTRQLVLVWNDISIQIADSCLLRGFRILVSNNLELGIGISGAGGINTLAENNKIIGGSIGVYFDGLDFNLPNFTLYKNIFQQNARGIEIFNASPLVRKNIIYNNNELGGRGINIGGFTNNYTPIIDSNYIEVISANGIDKSFGTRPIVTNNTIKLNDIGRIGIKLSTSDSARVFNNVVISNAASDAIYNSGIQHLQLNNNFVMGYFIYDAILMGPNNSVKNNAIIKADGEIRAWGTQNFTYKYNTVWGGNVSYSGFTPDSTNQSVDPMVVRGTGNIDSLDFHLQKYSPLIDAGDPGIFDRDGSRSDIGLYGGPFGETYTYLDLAPQPPKNLSAVVDTNKIILSWNKNTEADTSYHKVYRDTVQNFAIDSTKLISSPTDTFFIQSITHKVSKYVYKVTCVDKQGNESIPSLEVVVNLTSINDYPMIINDYVLYQNYPNPFNPKTKIAYKLKEGGYVKLYVYDIKGELIDVLVNQNQEGGYYEVEFPANNKELASGTYVYQIFVKNENNITVFTDFNKMMLLK